MAQKKKWSLFGGRSYKYYWIRWNPVLATQTLEAMGFPAAQHGFVGSLLVLIAPGSKEISCNVNRQAKLTNVSKKTAARAIQTMIQNDCVRTKIGNWENGFISTFYVVKFLDKMRKKCAEIEKKLGYKEGVISGKDQEAIDGDDKGEKSDGE